MTLTGGSISLSLLLSGSLLELHLTEVDDGSGTFVEGALLLGGESQHVEGVLRERERKR